MAIQLPQSVLDARTAAESAGKTASDLGAGAYTIEDELRKTVQEALDYNKDIIGMRSSALGDYLAAPAEGRKKFGVENFSVGDQAGQANPDYIWNPFERNSAIADYTKNQEIPFLTANTLLGQREGTIADTVKAGTGAYQAKTAAAAAAAEAANNTYQNVLNEFSKLTELNQNQQQIDISRANSGAGAKVNKLDQNAQLTQSLQNVIGKVDDAIKKNKGYVTKDEIKSFWNVEMPLLQNLGIDDNSILTYINATLAGDEVVDQKPADGLERLSSFLGGILNKGGSNKVTSPIPDFSGVTGSNLSRGVSNVNTFLDQFKSPTNTGSAGLKLTL